MQRGADGGETDLSTLSIGASVEYRKDVLFKNASQLKSIEKVVPVVARQPFQTSKCETILNHEEQYKRAKMRINVVKANIEEILDIKEELSKRRVMGFKYNYSLEQSV